MIAAADTLPVHDHGGRHAHRWHYPTVYLPPTRPGEMPFAMMGSGYCRVCGCSKLAAMAAEWTPRRQIEAALRYGLRLAGGAKTPQGWTSSDHVPGGPPWV